jgi:ABC-type phosphate transport system permease subunit
VPSVVFGLWGGRYLAAYLQPAHVWLHDTSGSCRSSARAASPNGRSLFTAGHRAGDHDPADHHRDLA